MTNLLRWGSVVGVLVAVLAFSPSAQARVYAPAPPGGGMVENPDGTFSLYGEGGRIRTYSSQEAARIATEDEALAVEVGETGQKASEFVHGITPAEQSAAEQLATQIRTGKLFETPGEAAVGEGVIAEAESAGTLATAATVTRSIAAGVGGAVVQSGAFFAGVEVGNAVDRTFGWPELCISAFGLFETGKCKTESGELQKKSETIERMKEKWGPEYKVPNERAKDCATSYPKIAALAGDYCVSIEAQFAGSIEKKVKEEPWSEPSAYPTAPPGFLTSWSGTNISPTCPTTAAPNVQYRKTRIKAPTIGCESQPKYNSFGNPEFEGKLYIDVSKLRDLQIPAKTHPEWNGSHHTAREEDIAPPLPGGTVLTPPSPNKVDKEVIKFIVHEREKEFPGVNEDGEPLTPEEQEEHVTPNPLWPEIPQPEPSETGKHYTERLHELGFTNAVEHELTLAQSNPRVGPEEVAYTSPSIGSRVNPETVIVVEVNPADAPSGTGGEGGSGFGSNLPELKLPKLGAVCKNFPFGVPCWLIEEFSAWSATGSTPTFTMDSFTVRGQKIGPASVSLAPLEPIMSKVRPFMVMFATIGLVLLFYKFATGGSPGSGGGTDSMGMEAEANIYGDKEVDSDGYWKGW